MLMRKDKEHQNIHSLPAYFDELMKPKPSNVAKIIASWDGLSTESQISILMHLSKVRLAVLPGLPDKLAKKIRVKALESKNAYVRYLGSTSLDLDKDNEEDMKIKKRIENDPDPVVRYSLFEDINLIPSLDKELSDPAVFWALPLEARLAKVSVLSGVGAGECMARLIRFAVEKLLNEGRITEAEIEEIICEFVLRVRDENWFKADRLSYDGDYEFQKGKNLEELWKIVPKKSLVLSYPLIAFLPTKGGLGGGLSDEIIKQMSDEQLWLLLQREDIYLPELRKKIFFSTDKEEYLRNAAVSHNFNLTYEEFTQILAKPDKEKVKDLSDLAFAQNLSLCLYEAINDVSYISEGFHSWTEFSQHSFSQRISEIQGYERDKELRELRLYRLAKKSVPWKKVEKGYPPSGELEFLAKSIIEGDTWGTFMAFLDAWGKQRDTSNLERYLPCIYEIDDLSRDETDTDETGAKTPEDWNATILNQFDKLQASFNRLKLLLYVVVALLIWLLIYRR
jgi:hypothetical protein